MAENNGNNNNKNGKNNKNSNLRGVLTLIAWALVLTVAFNYFNAYNHNTANKTTSHEIKYSEMIDMVEKNQVEEILFKDSTIYVTPVEGYVYTEEVTSGGKTEEKSYKQTEDGSLTLYTAYLSNSELLPLLKEHKVAYTGYYEAEMNPILLLMINYILPVIIMVGLFMLLMRLMSKSGGGGFGGIGNVGKSNAKVYMEKSTGVTFKDVAGQDEAKESLEEIIDFLHNPGRYTAIGAKLPKGALLVGSPGTGKTLLAKAVAGEADTAFLSISGSDFVEMYVGVGASRVRDLFEQAKKQAPAIVFIDEIDAVGRQRGSGLGGGHDEREQTLNQLLVEMDGFAANEGVVVLAATNRVDILDPALLRPGRFDRQVFVGLPDIKGREEILKIHAKGKPLAEDVDLGSVARATSGFTGADLENLLNEAALLTGRRGQRFITEEAIHQSVIKVIAGPEKHSRVVPEAERRLTAYHEAGHAVVMQALPDLDPVHQITIVPRGQAGGMTIYLPEEDRSYLSRRYMLDRVAGLLGGRAAEEMMLGDISTGASSDIQRATAIARKMVGTYGMSSRLGNVAFDAGTDEVFIGKSMAHTRPYSEKTAAEMDAEIRAIIDEAYEKCREILARYKTELTAVAEYLLEHETMDGDTFKTYFTQSGESRQ